MPLRALLASLALLVANVAIAGDRFRSLDDPPNSAVLSLWGHVAAEPPATLLLVGDDAPAFSYLGPDGEWHRFSDLIVQGPMLMVFGARDADLLELENIRSVFRDLGVTPVIVVDRRTGSAKAMAERLGLSAPVVVDPKCAIAGLYNSLDPRSLRHAPAFFVVDEKRTIRALGHGALPAAIEMVVLTARSLGLPLPESVWSLLGGDPIRS